MNWTNTTPKKVWPKKKLFSVRLYDRYDGYWIDIKKDLTSDQAQELWLKETKGGKEFTNYDDGSYYDIFPSDTKMIFDEP